MAERTLRFSQLHLHKKNPEPLLQQLTSLLENRTTRRRVLHAFILGITSLSASSVVTGSKETQIPVIVPESSVPPLKETSNVNDLTNVPELSLSANYVTREDFPRLNYDRCFNNYVRTLDWMSNSRDIAISSIPGRLEPHIFDSDQPRTDGAYAQVDVITVDATTGQKALKIVVFARSFDKVMAEEDLKSAAKQLFYETIILEQAQKNPLKFATDTVYRNELQKDVKNISFFSIPPNKQLTY